MSIEEIRKIYHEKVIPKEGRSEIKLEFMNKFGYAHPQQFTMKMKPGSILLPTPKEFDWLSETIWRYYNYYKPEVEQAAIFNESVQ